MDKKKEELHAWLVKELSHLRELEKNAINESKFHSLLLGKIEAYSLILSVFEE